MRNVPYLRVVVTTQCPLGCDFCHAEGEPPTSTDRATALATREVVDLVGVAIASGVRKVKFLGGEPLARRDLPEIIAGIRALDGDVDLSLITAGAVDRRRLDACFAAGLSRANLSMHGFGLPAFLARTHSSPIAFKLREQLIEALFEYGRFLKLNYVYTGQDDEADLAELLTWAASRPVVVGVLDELSSGLGPQGVREALLRLRGPASSERIEPDPFSLPTHRLHWDDGLEVEVKSSRLGQLAPWRACGTCPKRATCAEGIHAVRLSTQGELRPCLDRPDLGVDLGALLRSAGPSVVRTAWSHFMETQLACG